MNNATQITNIFNSLFIDSERTKLVGGAEEPIYLPYNAQRSVAELYFRADYERSALHEIAHWCVAGPKRREQEDFGYWYQPDGRSAQQQQAFFQVEVEPQALEWLFAIAAGIPFRVSVDNLNGEPLDTAPFRRDVQRAAQRRLVEGLPQRPAKLVTAFQKQCPQSQWDRVEDLVALGCL